MFTSMLPLMHSFAACRYVRPECCIHWKQTCHTSSIWIKGDSVKPTQPPVSNRKAAAVKTLHSFNVRLESGPHVCVKWVGHPKIQMFSHSHWSSPVYLPPPRWGRWFRLVGGSWGGGWDGWMAEWERWMNTYSMWIIIYYLKEFVYV